MNSWSKHQAVDIIMPEEARKVRTEKVITSRFVFTTRNHAKRIAGEAQAALEKILGELTDGSLKKEEPLSKDQRLSTAARTLVKGAEWVS